MKFEKLFLILLLAFLLSSCRTSAAVSVSTPNVQETADVQDTPEPADVFFDFEYQPEQGVVQKSTFDQNEGFDIRIYYPETESREINERVLEFVLKLSSDTRSAGSSRRLLCHFKTYYYNEQIISFLFDISEETTVDGEKSVTFTKKSLMFERVGGTELQPANIFGGNADWSTSVFESLKGDIPELTPEDIRWVDCVVLDAENILFYINRQNSQVSLPLSSLSGVLDIDNYIHSLFAFNEIEEQFPVETSQPEYPSIPQADVSQYPVGEYKYIALTFDDGPEKTNTPRILDALKEYDAKATFFVLGHRVEANAEIIRRMIDEGHSVGNHSYNHKELTKLKTDKLSYQIDTTSGYIREITGQDVYMLRPPYGSRNSRVIEAARQRGMAIILWDIDPEDWKHKNAETICENIVSKAKDGDIILVHDIYSTSVDGAIMAVQQLTEQGFRFVTVPELLSMYGLIEPGKVYRFAQK